MDAISSGGNGPRVVDAGRGLGWWVDAWALFMRNPGMWVVFGVVCFVLFVVLSFIPFLGSLVVALLSPVLMAGWLIAARKLEAGGTLEVGDLFSAFKSHLNPLMVLGALLLGVTIVIGLMAGMLGVGAAAGLGIGGARGSAAGMMAGLGAGMLAVLLMLVVGFLVGMAIWFAPALVVFRNMAPIDAAKASFAASLKNVMAFLVFGAIYIVAAIVASIPFGLGWLVLVPLLALCAYLSYKEVFE
ncbi:MAG: hypothetical protein IPP44_01785 [Ideonella sp.]|nr:hypothetical protein [Ideonella sp.]